MSTKVDTRQVSKIEKEVEEGQEEQGEEEGSCHVTTWQGTFGKNQGLGGKENRNETTLKEKERHHLDGT